MIVIAGSIDLDPALREEALAKGKPFIDGALTQRGCRHYTWTPDPFDKGRIWVYELWEDEEALASHFQNHHYADMGGNLGQHGITGSEISKFRVDLEEPVYDDTGTPRADFFTAAS